MLLLRRIIVFAALLASTLSPAQTTTIFTEEFETNGQFSMSPGWVWDGAAPVPAPACQYGSWSVQKDVHGPSDLFWGGTSGARWMFHPLPYDPLMQYGVSLNAAKVGLWDDSVVVHTHTTWWDTLQGNPFSSGGYHTPIYSCGAHTGVFYQASGQPAGLPNSQFGVLIYAFTWSNVQMLLDHIVVQTKPYKAQFVGNVLLGGPYDPLSQTMSDALRQQGLVPLTEPYTALGWPQVSGGGGETVTPAVLNATYAGGHVVDWVRLELRKHSDPTVLMATRQALVLQNGTVISTTGTQSVLFDILPGNYYVAVRHRNHLGTMSFAPYTVPYPGGGIWTYQFADGFGGYGTNPVQVIGNKRVLWPGNARKDNVLKYAGSNNDRDKVLLVVGGGTPTNTVSGYYSEDVNMDGVVKYAGAVNDRDRILVAIGGTVPTATRVEQMP
ncbi:MAG: hypothetical protein IPH53_04585 [Flavobacteriales bacterium]|nr:hypothetical protein [Flavobacteriales bacterium]MBK9075039.1 hypothetical protein [Flavobacteriales bacterium]MBK9540103.1 hypothetical protein [Flavobacteriales bacterium]